VWVCGVRVASHLPHVPPGMSCAGALQFGIFPLAKRAGRSLGPLWLSTTFVELFAGACSYVYIRVVIDIYI